MEEFEQGLPKEFRKDHSEVIARNPDSDSDENFIDEFITQQTNLFTDTNYVRNKAGYYINKEDGVTIHPLQNV